MMPATERNRLTVSEKLAILDASRGLPPPQAATRFGVSRSSIVRWRASEESLRQQRPSARRHAISRSTAHVAPNLTAVRPIVSGDRTPVRQAAEASSTVVARTNLKATPPTISQNGDGGRDLTCPPDQVISSLAGAVATTRPPTRFTNSAETIPSVDESPPSPQSAHSRTVTSARPGSGYHGGHNGHQTTAASKSSSLALHRQSARTSALIIGYVGRGGTIADEAVRNTFPVLQVDVPRAHEPIRTAGYAHPIDAIDAVVHKVVDYCVVPVTWLLSVDSSFALDEFTSRPLLIAGEIAYTPQLCLSALPGTALRDCNCVMSDAALLQAKEAMILRMEADRGAPIVRQVVWDSAGACFMVRDQAAQGIAVLAGKAAAAAAGLCVLIDDVDADNTANDTSNNEMRYLIVGRLECASIVPLNTSSRSCSSSRHTLHALSMRKTTLFVLLRDQHAWLSALTRAFEDAGMHILDIHTRVAAPASGRAREHQVLVSYLPSTTQPSSAATHLLQQRLGELTIAQRELGTYYTVSMTAREL